MKRLFLLMFLLLSVGLAHAGNDDNNQLFPPGCGSNTSPNTNLTALGCSNAGTNLYTWMTKENAGEEVEHGFTNFVYTGIQANACLGTTGASLVMTPVSCIAYNAQIRSTETGSITFANNSTTWVAMDENTSGSNAGLPNFGRVSGTHYLIDSIDSSQPAMVADSQLLMKVVTSGGSITAVTDLRSTATSLTLGSLTVTTLNTVTLNAARFAGADWSLKTAAALAACPSGDACIIDMRSLDTSTPGTAAVTDNTTSNVTFLLGAQTYSMAAGQKAFVINPTTSAGLSHVGIVGPEPSGAVISCSTGISGAGCIDLSGTTGFLGPYAITNTPAVGASSFTANGTDITAASLTAGDRLIVADRQAGPSDGGIDSRRTIWVTVTSVAGTTVNISQKLPLALNSTAAGTWIKLPDVLSYPIVKNVKVTTASGFAALGINGAEFAIVQNNDLSNTAAFKAYNHFQCWRCLVDHNIWETRTGNVHAAEIESSPYNYFSYNSVTCPDGPVAGASVIFEYGCTGSHMSTLNDTCSTGNTVQILDSDQFVFENSNIVAGVAEYLITGSTGSRFIHNIGIGGTQGININNNIASNGVYQTTHTYGTLACVTRVTDNGDLFCTEVGGTTGGAEPAWTTCNATAGAFAYGQVGCTTTDSGGVVWTYFGRYNVSSGNIVSDNIIRSTTNALSIGQDAAGLIPAFNNTIANLDINSTVTNLLLTGPTTVQTLTQMCTNGWIFSHRDSTTNLVFDECPRSIRNQLQMRGTTSGTGTFSVPAAVGTPTWTMQTVTGTIAEFGKSVIGSVPTCNATTEGWYWTATDCNAGCAAGGTCTTGAATHCGLYCNGTAWVETGI